MTNVLHRCPSAWPRHAFDRSKAPPLYARLLVPIPVGHLGMKREGSIVRSRMPRSGIYQTLHGLIRVQVTICMEALLVPARSDDAMGLYLHGTPSIINVYYVCLPRNLACELNR